MSSAPWPGQLLEANTQPAHHNVELIKDPSTEKGALPCPGSRLTANGTLEMVSSLEGDHTFQQGATGSHHRENRPRRLQGQA